MRSETYAEYLARGGKVTICPPGPKPKRYKTPRVKVQGPDHDTRKQEAKASEIIDLNLIPESLRIALGYKK